MPSEHLAQWLSCGFPGSSEEGGEQPAVFRILASGWKHLKLVSWRNSASAKDNQKIIFLLLLPGPWVSDNRLHNDYTPSWARQLLGSHSLPGNRSLPGEIALLPASLPSAPLSYLGTTLGSSTLSQAPSCRKFVLLAGQAFTGTSQYPYYPCVPSIEGLQQKHCEGKAEDETTVRTHFHCHTQQLSSSVAPWGPYSLTG